METHDRFSTRHGYTPEEAEISVRHEAPYDLRGALIQIAYDTGLRPKPLRKIVCRVLRERPDPNNWSEHPNIAEEIETLVDNAEWYEVYDIMEEIYRVLSSRDYALVSQGQKIPTSNFADELNKYFRKKGIGWQLVDGRIEIRGPETFEQDVRGGLEALKKADRKTAAHELHQALLDLSRRPDPDITGAIQHAMAALECTARDVCGDPKSTLGDIIKRNPGLLPKPVDQSVEKAWGYSSEMGRHLREGRIPTFEEAELVVGLAGVICRYLSRKSD